MAGGGSRSRATRRQQPPFGTDGPVDDTYAVHQRRRDQPRLPDTQRRLAPRRRSRGWRSKLCRKKANRRGGNWIRIIPSSPACPTIRAKPSLRPSTPNTPQASRAAPDLFVLAGPLPRPLQRRGLAILGHACFPAGQGDRPWRPRHKGSDQRAQPPASALPPGGRGAVSCSAPSCCS